TGGSWGLQIGGQAIDLVMLVMNQKGMDALLSSKFKVGADASAAAGPVGRQSEASTDWKMKAEVLTYSRARGVFAGIDLSGSRIAQDQDETRVLYGKMVPFATILSGKVDPPSGSEAFLAAVKQYASQELRKRTEKCFGPDELLELNCAPVGAVFSQHALLCAAANLARFLFSHVGQI